MKKIIIDTDIGDDIDDAFALLTALSEPELEILGSARRLSDIYSVWQERRLSPSMRG